ncbi:FecR family protein [Dyella humicola]|uniref:FecR family protein n=1 Tax=Dyella humicola TaxID=2992126 RepID=UPI002255799D|nr:FecR domain-containing protein [Dyella humicola]
MNKPRHFEDANHARRITEQAASWYLEQQDEPSERQRAAFLAWLRASPAHVAEYLAIAQMHGDLKAAASLQMDSAGALIERAARENPVVMFPKVAVDAPRDPVRPSSGLRRLTRPAAGAIAAVAVALLVLLGVARWNTLRQVEAQSYVAGADSVRAVKLSDGTLVQMGRGSSIDVHFDARYRRIEVVRGQALFDVGKDPARPMFVRVGGHVLQDIGTVFDVNRDAEGDTLTVISGRVRVLLASRTGTGKDAIGTDAPLIGGDAMADLISGQQVELSASGVGTVEAAKIEQATAWLPEDIRFHRETVGDVARRFNAYTTRPLVIEDERIASMRISGVFHANNPHAFITYLATLPDVRIEQDGERVRVVASSSHGAVQAGRL